MLHDRSELLNICKFPLCPNAWIFENNANQVRMRWILYKVFILVIFVTVIPFRGFTQHKHEFNNLSKPESKDRPDTNYLGKLLISSEDYLSKAGENLKNPDSAAYFSGLAFRFSSSHNMPYYHNESMCFLGNAYILKGDLKKGRKLFYRVLAYYKNKKDEAKEAQTWFRFGQSFMTIKTHFSPQLQDDANFDEMMRYFNNALDIAVKISDEAMQSRILIQMADFNYLQKGDLKLAEKQYLRVLALHKSIGNSKMQDAYSGLMALNYFKGNFSKALSYGMEALTSAEGKTGYNNLDIVYFYFGNIYRDMGDKEKSLDQYEKGLIEVENKGEFEYLYSALVRNKVRILIAEGKEKPALAFLQSQLTKHPPVYPINKTIFAESFGHCYYALKEYALAEKYFDELASLSKKIGGVRAVYQYYTMAKFYFDIRHFDKANYYFLQVLAAPPGIVPVSILQRAHLMCFKIDSASGQYLTAIDHYRQHTFLKDSVFNETKSRQIEELQIKYETEKKEKDIKLLINQGQLREAAQTKNVIVAGICILVVVLGMGYNRYRIKQQSHEKLQAKQEVINQKNSSLQNLIAQQRKLLDEKEWLLKEIHHRVKNNLQIVMSLLNTQSAFIDNDAALTAIRHSQHRMYAMSLIHQKLYESKSVAWVEMSAYIEELVEYLRDSYDIHEKIIFNIRMDWVELDVSQAVPVGLILNEAITNCIKSAFPDGRNGVVNIDMKRTDRQELKLVISDNGIGLDPDFSIEKSNSLGMSLMSGLSRQLGGIFLLETSAGLKITIVFKEVNVNELMAWPEPDDQISERIV